MAEREIDGATYSCAQLDPDAGLDMALRVLRILGPARGLVRAAMGRTVDGEILEALARFIGEMDEKAVQGLIHDLVKLTACDGAAAKPRNLREMLLLAAFALETQFADIFPTQLLMGKGDAYAA